MTKGVSNIFTYNQFEDQIKLLIKFAKQEHYLEMALGVNIEGSLLDAHIALLADMFPENNENYLVDYKQFWRNWKELVGLAIISFVYGVVDYVGDGNVVAPHNHELLHIKSATDKINKNSTDYIVSLNSTQTLWKICTGEIPVRERFS